MGPITALPLAAITYLSRKTFLKDSTYRNNPCGRVAKLFDSKMKALCDEPLMRRAALYTMYSNAWIASKGFSYFFRSDPVEQAKEFPKRADILCKQLDLLHQELKALRECFTKACDALEASLQKLETVSQQQKDFFRSECKRLEDFQIELDSKFKQIDIKNDPYLMSLSQAQKLMEEAEEGKREWLARIQTLRSNIDKKPESSV